MVKNRDMQDEDAQATEPKKPRLKQTWKEICRKQRGLMVAMIVLFVLSVGLLIFALTTLRPSSAVVIVGYGDVYGEVAGLSGGYRRDSWVNMLAFPVLALVFGVVHNILAIKVYRKYGKDMALILVYATMMMIGLTVVVILRLLGEW